MNIIILSKREMNNNHSGEELMNLNHNDFDYENQNAPFQANS